MGKINDDDNLHFSGFVKGDVAGGCKLLRNRFESKDREWASYTCVLGFHVMGENKLFFLVICDYC